MQVNSSRQILMGARDTLPLIFAAIPFGVIYGALAISSGLSESIALAMSLFVFAGASQFIAVSLIASTAAIPVILITVFIVNLRHMLYAASLMPQASKVSKWIRIPMAFWLTDETFAVVSNRLNQDAEAPGFLWYYFGSAIAMYSFWIISTWTGITLGQHIPDMASWGLDVALVVAFIGIVVPALKNRSHWACALTGAVTAVLCHDWPHQTGLLFASLLAITLGVFLDRNTLKELRHD